MLYSATSLGFSIAAIVWQAGEFPAVVNAGQVAVGLLLLAVWSAASLAEERARGSLDLLLCARVFDTADRDGQVAGCVSTGAHSWRSCPARSWVRSLLPRTKALPERQV